MSLICIVVLAFGAALVYEYVTGDASIDPTDPVNFYTLHLQNDTPQTLTVKILNPCWDKDPHCDASWRLNPGAGADQTSPRNSDATYFVYNNKRERIGCLYTTVQQSHLHGTLTVRLSSMVACK